VRVGIIGGGQLGRMLVLAGRDLDIECVTLDPAEDSPASQVGPAIVGAYDDLEALLRLAEGADVVTYEFENVPAASTRFLAERGMTLRPPPVSLATAQDRLEEKRLFEAVGLPVPAFAPVDDLASLNAALERTGLPAVLKTRRLGYDGKGQAVIRDREEAPPAWDAVGRVPSLCEALVPFDREVSIVAVRGADGAFAAWPLVQNTHREGILRVSVAPAPDAEHLQALAETHAQAFAEHLGHVGVLAVELFEHGGRLLGNELAPRVHNSGHWTIEGSMTSQFANHLRAICGRPLGPTEMAHPVAAMVNLVGSTGDERALAAIPGAHVHLYGKAPRPDRKLGHVTLIAGSPDALRELVLQVDAVSADA
jgi:5-(carboxyamino)imidazole ribonucleotide synthase